MIGCGGGGGDPEKDSSTDYPSNIEDSGTDNAGGIAPGGVDNGANTPDETDNSGDASGEDTSAGNEGASSGEGSGSAGEGAGSDSAKITDCLAHNPYSVPTVSDQILCWDNYSVGYNYTTKQPDWVAYSLQRDKVNLYVERTDDFHGDESIPESVRSTLDHYKYSGYIAFF
ncbi:DNA/RNA non-specific endonuclease [Zhongshania borealis]|uniref:DNA/RNA non-specific endonuclease/pyrophosphatase/phosphodiesterase domain-containing protein n=1 Tax=Zhongshania borealis TaxID=889488 RepID=A0ABP7WR91_9GAMM